MLIALRVPHFDRTISSCGHQNFFTRMVIYGSNWVHVRYKLSFFVQLTALQLVPCNCTSACSTVNSIIGEIKISCNWLAFWLVIVRCNYILTYLIACFCVKAQKHWAKSTHEKHRLIFRPLKVVYNQSVYFYLIERLFSLLKVPHKNLAMFSTGS